MTFRRALLAALALLVVFAIGWRSCATPTSSPDPARTKTPSAEDDAPGRRRRSTQESLPTPEAAADSAESVERDAPLAPGTRVEPTGEIDVLVVDETDRPIDGAQVVSLPLRQSPETVREMFDGAYQLVDRIVARNAAVTTDTGGRVRLPRSERTLLVVGQRGEERGTVVVAPEEAGARLVLHRPRTLSVRVEDDAGRPCPDVGVLLVADTDMGMFPATDPARTEADGLATLRGLGPRPTGTSSAVVSAQLPFVPRPSVAVAFDPPPAQPVRLVLPPSGRLRCEVVEESGSPAADGVVVLLRLPEDRSRVLVPGLLETWTYFDARATVQRGVATFPHVGVGLELVVEVEAPDATRSTSRTRVAGPTRAGEETSVRVVVGGPRLVVVGRVVDPHGAPVPDLELKAALVETGDQGPRVVRDGPSATDAAGRFRFSFDRASGAAAARVRLERAVVSGDDYESTSALADVALPATLAAGETDVGNIVWKGGAPMFAGVVVDGTGRPLAGVTVRVMSESELTTSRYAPDEFDAATTDAEGRFMLRGERPDDAGIGASLDGFYAERIDASDPAHVTVVLRQAGGIAGSVKLPPGVDAFDVRVLIDGEATRNGDAESHFDDALTLHTEPPGRFELRTLRPGLARVRLQLGPFGEDVLVTVDDVRVVAGEIARDPRLQDVDLAKWLHDFHVTVLDGDRRPLPGAAVHVRPVGTTESWKEWRTGADGRALVRVRTVAPPKLDVVVRRTGFRFAELRAEAKDLTVALVKAARPTAIRVRLAAATPLPASPFELRVELKWVERQPGSAVDPRDLGWMSAGARTFGVDRIVTFDTWDPGSYEAELTLTENGSEVYDFDDEETEGEPTVVSVPADAESVEVVVGMDAETLRRRTSRGR